MRVESPEIMLEALEAEIGQRDIRLHQSRLLLEVGHFLMKHGQEVDESKFDFSHIFKLGVANANVKLRSTGSRALISFESDVFNRHLIFSSGVSKLVEGDLSDDPFETTELDGQRDATWAEVKDFRRLFKYAMAAEENQTRQLRTAENGIGRLFERVGK